MDELLKKISISLESKFIYNNKAFAMQCKNDLDEVVYNTCYNNFDAITLVYMLKNKKGILSYQQNGDKLKWICFDFDIKSSILNNEKSFNVFGKNKYMKELKKSVSKLVKYLENKNLKYVMEFSGNRGIHIWMHFSSSISKKQAFFFMNFVKKMIIKDEKKVILQLIYSLLMVCRKITK